MTQQNNQPSFAKASEGHVQIKAEDHILKGVYSNAANVMHTKEEFVFDFMNVFPPNGTLNARVIVSPGHFKQLIAAMQDNLKKYEEKFGPVEASETPNKGIGFQPKE